MEITLREVTQQNWRECVDLKVAPEQENFVAPNLFSIAESKFEPDWRPLAIYVGETIVGFTMVGRDERDGSYWIIRLMIDAAYQRRGYGRAAMKEVIRQLKQKPDCREIKISFMPENVAAEKLYLSLGFERTGWIEDGEVVLMLPLR
ncbi:MAG: GNAT family N-acetyltransferase [Anaerolineales bacterium]|nr:GNAT family N-acetyltransferase [Anaerolineales bacterium]